MTTLWIISVMIKNVSIVDIFWGFGFVITSGFYFFDTEGFETRKIVLMVLVSLWGLRLSGYIAWRNRGKGEDFRYREFRKKYGENRYWWISYFQTFLLQGLLMWLISAPLLGAQYYTREQCPGHISILQAFFSGLWVSVLRQEEIFSLPGLNPIRQTRVRFLTQGFWKYTRHPNYFGDSAVWWGYGIICLSAGSYLPVLGSVLMTAMIIKVSGVALLEKSLVDQKPQYSDYIEKTSSFFPWFPKK